MSRSCDINGTVTAYASLRSAFLPHRNRIGEIIRVGCHSSLSPQAPANRSSVTHRLPLYRHEPQVNSTLPKSSM